MKLYDNLRAVLFPSGYKSAQIYPQKPLIWNNPAYWYAPRVAGNYCSSPYNAAITLRNNLDIKCLVKATQTSIEQIVFGTGSGSIKFSFRISSSNTLRFLCSVDGTTALIYDSTIALPSPSALQWIRLTRNATTGVLLFYTSSDGTTWTQLGTSVAGAIGALFNTTSIYEIGSTASGATSALFNGFIYRVLVSETINGVNTIDFNPNHFNWNSNMLQNGQTFTSRTTGEVWTINSTGQGYIQPYLETISFTRGSSGTRQLPSGIIENLAANMPRLDSPLNGCAGILMEPQRTNLVLRSQAFDNASWGKNGTSVSANAAISPDGTSNADLVYPAASGIDKRIQQSVTVTNATSYTCSFFAKAAGKNWVAITDINIGSVAYFDLQNGVLGWVGAGITATITAKGNGWYLCTATSTTTTTTGYFYCMTVDGNGSLSVPYSSVTVNGTDGIYLWNAQIEQGSLATSPIVTDGSTVTRSADVITGANYQMMGLGGRGTIVIDYTLLGLPSSTGGNPFMLVDNATINTSRIYLLGEFSNGLRVWDYINGIYWYNAAQTVGNRYKVLIKWDGRYGCCYVNGAKVFENFNLSPIYLNHIKLMQMVSASIRLNGFHTDNIAVSHADCVKLTS